MDVLAEWYSAQPYLGYGFHFGNDVWFEAAGGLGYSLLDGLGQIIVLQVGTELGNGWFITLPWTYKYYSVDTYFLIGTTW